MTTCAGSVKTITPRVPPGANTSASQGSSGSGVVASCASARASIRIQNWNSSASTFACRGSRVHENLKL